MFHVLVHLRLLFSSLHPRLSLASPPFTTYSSLLRFIILFLKVHVVLDRRGAVEAAVQLVTELL